MRSGAAFTAIEHYADHVPPPTGPNRPVRAHRVKDLQQSRQHESEAPARTDGLRERASLQRDAKPNTSFAAT
jgi:hypothetical protein